MVVLGYAIKKIGVISKEDGIALSRVVMNITLPCAIIVSFRTFVFDISYMIIPVISFAANWLMLGLGWAISRGRDRDSRVFYMMELPAYNIGNFTLPFVSSILGPLGVVGTCLFDMGNAPLCLGLSFIFTSMAIGENPGRSITRSVLSVFTKPAFTAHCVMLLLSALSITLPDPVFEFAGMISPANAPMAMIMIGLMLDFHMDFSKLKAALSANVLRLALASVIAASFFLLTPFPYEVRKAVAITAFSPISSASPGFVAALKGDVELVGFASTLSIIISLVLMPVLLSLL